MKTQTILIVFIGLAWAFTIGAFLGYVEGQKSQVRRILPKIVQSTNGIIFTNDGIPYFTIEEVYKTRLTNTGDP